MNKRYNQMLIDLSNFRAIAIQMRERLDHDGETKLGTFPGAMADDLIVSIDRMYDELELYDLDTSEPSE